MEIHALRYETEASVQINGGPWTPINSSTVAIQGLGAAFGGIGGGYSTLKMILNLRVDDVKPGENTLAFRFNETNGRASGFRVLAFNIVASNGVKLIPQSSFVEDDPSKWQPPFTSVADIQAGKTLWNGAGLTAPGFGVLRAKCASCHAQDGRDLKYFNYSNVSIRARSIFHGLTARQGDQIASYIRTLDAPSPGRPWNPPYQPGPGSDSKPVADWAAGAGLDAVLDNDAQMEQYLAPGESTAGWSAKAYLNPREIPIAMQMLDWNSWLPGIHPMDAFGASFTNGRINQDYPKVRSILKPNSPAAYRAALDPISAWMLSAGDLLIPIETKAGKDGAWGSNDLRNKVYSMGQWQMVKLWELNQEFGLEGMPQVPFGAKADVRGWFGGQAFYTSPNMLHIPAGPGIGNGSEVVRTYLALIWYQTQLVLNDGQGKQTGHSPIDFPYVSGFIKDLFVNDARVPGIMMELEWKVKSLQEFTLTGIPPLATADDGGWHANATSIESLVHHDWLPLWSATSSATRTKLVEGYTRAWFAQASQYTPEQYQQNGWAKVTDDPATQGAFGEWVWYTLPRLRLFGVDARLIQQMTDWAAKVWPAGNWALNSSTTCTSVTQCTASY
jgi:hypothetical protein